MLRLVAGMKAWHLALVTYSSDSPSGTRDRLGTDHEDGDHTGFFKPGGEANIPSQIHDVVIVNQVCN